MPRKKKDAPAEPLEEKAPAVSGEALEEKPVDETTLAPEVSESGESPAPAKGAALVPPGRPAVVRSPSGLNLRAGPGVSFEVGEVLPDGAEVEALPLWSAGPQGQFDVHIPGWEYVFTGKSVGWALARFLRLQAE